ncbi:hypothetical protein EC973_004783 [Apophysomyces ossiformis]|uniref:Uncharacterized protein n=1 Tax=Apophysomyces ossiformis TaxID=679940 RepID=A0A8H7BWP5_9FUNG|nr:hypothetical protein EC973_004783 [Apophysomyces ossiformis]
MADSPKEKDSVAVNNDSETPKEVLVVESESMLETSEKEVESTSTAVETSETIIATSIPTVEAPEENAIIAAAPTTEPPREEPTVTAIPTVGSSSPQPTVAFEPLDNNLEDTIMDTVDNPNENLANCVEYTRDGMQPETSLAPSSDAGASETGSVPVANAHAVERPATQKYEDFHQFLLKARESHKMLPTMKRSLEDAVTLEEIDKRIQKRHKANKAAVPATPDVALDRGKFYQRLKTFPPSFIETRRPITAPKLSMHGWQFVETKTVNDKDIAYLTCNDCQSSMAMISLELYENDNPAVAKVIKRYEEGLFGFHSEQCPWRLYHYQIYSFPLRKSSETIERIETEGRKFLGCGPELPAIRYSLTESQLKDVQYLVSSFENLIKENGTSSPTDTMMTAYVLPIFGWCLKEVGSVKALTCQDCFRTVGLHQIKTSEHGESEKLDFDALTQHRDYCPWGNNNRARLRNPNEVDDKDTLINGIQWVLAMVAAEAKSRRDMYEELLGPQESREEQRRENNRALEAEAQEVLNRIPT